MDETPQYTDTVTCPICGASIPTVKMDVGFAVLNLSRLTWPASLQLPDRFSHVCCVGYYTHCAAMTDFAKAALLIAMVYFCVWGQIASNSMT
jgi:hypothetical protein